MKSNLLRNDVSSTPLRYSCRYPNQVQTVSKPIQHHILTKPDAQPVRGRAFHPPMRRQEYVAQQVKSMLASGVISQSESPWSSPVVLVPKKNGELRFCVDFRPLNAITKFDGYPMPLAEDLFDKLVDQSLIQSLTQWQKVNFIAYIGVYAHPHRS